MTQRPHSLQAERLVRVLIACVILGSSLFYTNHRRVNASAWQGPGPCSEINFLTIKTQRLSVDVKGPFQTADFNRDQISDLVVSSSSDLVVLLGREDGSYGAPRLTVPGPPDSSSIPAVTTLDLNQDGNLDLATSILSAITPTGGISQLSVFYGDGVGGFAPPRQVSFAGGAASLAAGDVNKDGKIDLAATRGDSNLLLFLNDGQGGLNPPRELIGQSSPFSIGLTRLEISDLDGDGKLDILAAGHERSAAVFKGDGAGGFTARLIDSISFGTEQTAIGDFNGDGRLDLVGLTRRFENDELIEYLNNGAAQFTAQPGAPSPNLQYSSGEILVDDFNRDGKSDVLVPALQLHLFLASPDGRLTTSLNYILDNAIRFDYATGDSNGDGRLDLFILANFGMLSIAPGQEQGLAAPRAFAAAKETRDVAAADFNRDGRMDLAVTNGGDSVSLLIGDGRGGFTSSDPIRVSDATGLGRLVVRDFNLDQNADFAILDASNRKIRILLGDGRGGFSNSDQLSIGNPLDLNSADFNRDGAPDLVSTGQNGGLVIFLGDGNGAFTPNAMGIGGEKNSLWFTIGDFNGDGAADLAYYDEGQSRINGRFRLNVQPGNGAGGFETEFPVLFDVNLRAFAVGDLNLDGRDDLLATTGGGGQDVLVRLSNPSGGFTEEARYQASDYIDLIQPRDLNGDGKLDLIVMGSSGLTTLAGRGDGGFASPRKITPYVNGTRVDAADFNLDGKPDLAITLPNSKLVGVLLNRTGCSSSGVATLVSAASFSGTQLAPNSIGSIFGAGLATSSESAASTPLPTRLAGVAVRMVDSLGVERLSPLFFASPGQINFLTPDGVSRGTAIASVIDAKGEPIAVGSTLIARSSPGLFSASSTGSGPAASLILRVKPDGAQVYESVARFDAAQNRFVAQPISLDDPADQVFLILYGTGFRDYSLLERVFADIDGTTVRPTYAGPQGGLVGLDQANLPLPRTLIGRGLIDVSLMVDAVRSNRVQIYIQ